MVSITTTWTTLSYAFGSLLTSAKQTQLYNNGVMVREWMGETFVNSAVQDHTHDGKNSAQIAAGGISTSVRSEGTIVIPPSTFTTPSAGIYNMVVLAGSTVRFELNILASWRQGKNNIGELSGAFFDGTNMRLNNLAVSSETIYFQYL